MEDWKKEFDSICTKAHQESSSDLTGLRRSFEQAAKKYFQAGTMHNGDEYPVHITSGPMLIYKMYQDHIDIYTAIDLQDVDMNLPRKELVSLEDAKSGNYVKLEAISDVTFMGYHFIGERYPENMVPMLKDLHPGDIITFNQGGTYVALDQHEQMHHSKVSTYITLKKVFEGNLCRDNLAKLHKKEIVELDTGSFVEMQQFYNKNSKVLTERLEFSISKSSEAHEKLEEMEAAVRAEGMKLFQFGDIPLRATKSKDSDEVLWYDCDNSRIDREDIALMNALINNQMVERRYLHTKSSIFDLHNDKEFEKKMELLSVKRDYEGMYEQMIQRVGDTPGALTIDFDHLTPSKDGYSHVPEKITFTNENGLTKCYRTLYEDNDPPKDILSVTELSKKDFALLCESLGTQNYNVLCTKTEEVMPKQYEHLKENMNDTQRRILDNAIDKKLCHENVTPVRFSITDKKVTELLQGYVKSSKHINVRDILEKVQRDCRYVEESMFKERQREGIKRPVGFEH